MAATSLMEKPSTLRAVFERIDSGGEGSDIAFSIADKAMRAAGVTWTDLLEAYLNPASGPSTDPVAAAFENVFGGFKGFEAPAKSKAYDTPAAEPARAAPRRRQFFQGSEIPAEIGGRIKTEYRQNIRTGEMLVVTVENDEAICGPLVIFDADHIKLVDENPDAVFYAHVIKARNSRHNPKISKLQLA